MNVSKLVNTYTFQTAAYQNAFQVFLDHTDQKASARSWLNRLVQDLPSRQVFIDAGAGSGKITSWFIENFQKTIAIEPNPHLRHELYRACPTAEVLAKTILEADPLDLADFVLCSHVFYYISSAAWMLHLEKLASWLAANGVLVVVFQNHKTDCIQMLSHFSQQQFYLSELISRFRSEKGDHYSVDVETVPAQVVTTDFDSAYTIAEFMLNQLPMPSPPPRHLLEEYVREYFADLQGGFRFSCDQEFLQIRRLL